MPRTECARRSSHVNPARLLFAVLGILTMPVDYRAGAANPHPHATLQLISDLAQGTFDHHGEPVDGLGHVHGNPSQGHALPIRRAAPAQPATSTDLPPPPTTALLTPRPDQHIPVADRVTAADEPTVSPRSGGGISLAYMVLLPSIVIIFARWLVRRVDWAAATAWNGVSHPPELPPPRSACRP